MQYSQNLTQAAANPTVSEELAPLLTHIVAVHPAIKAAGAASGQ
jgi:hypothetical protein